MSRRARILGFLLIASATALIDCGHLTSRTALAGSLFRDTAVGGISIDVDGVVGQPPINARQLLRQRMLALVSEAPAELAQVTELRKISLKRLEAAITEAMNNNDGALPDEIKYLAGIQRVKYIFVFPEQNDVVLAGPGEGWMVDENGHVVGVTSGKPVIHIDDLLIAFRSAHSARVEGITCSIDPTTEGLRALNKFLARQRQFHGGLSDEIERVLGPQNVTITGVPTDSHFARVLVACDYRMKRIAMNLEQSPVKGLPGFLDLIKSRRGGPRSMSPRWWLACNYEPLARSQDGLAWELRGPGVKAMTEQDFVAADGTVQHTGRHDPLAQKWADLMTEHYDELATVDVVFGQLRNLMDLCVIAALVEKEQLLSKANCSLALITQEKSPMMPEGWNAAKTVATQCSFLKKGSNYIITASGGVEIGSWQVIQSIQKDPAVGETRIQSAVPARSSWWWN